MIIFNHMQRFYYLICQSNWCQNASKLIYQKGEISILWDIQNVVHCKSDFDVWRWTGRWQISSGPENRPTPGMLFPNTRCSILPPCSILPRLTIYVMWWQVAVQTNRASKARWEEGLDHTILMLMNELFSIFPYLLLALTHCGPATP